jgi:hypothetical protein
VPVEEYKGPNIKHLYKCGIFMSFLIFVIYMSNISNMSNMVIIMIQNMSTMANMANMSNITNRSNMSNMINMTKNARVPDAKRISDFPGTSCHKTKDCKDSCK